MGRILAMPLKGQKAYYAYDAASNSIIEVHKSVYEVLRTPDRLDKEVETRNAGPRPSLSVHGGAVASLRSAAREYGFFQQTAPRDYSYIATTDFLNTILDGSLAGLTLEVSEQCNQRCRYCTYSGGFTGPRTHGERMMSWSVARQVIDYVLPRTDPAKKAKVGFYGGEPLLNFELIRECVQHLRRSGRLAQPDFRISTNLTLLNENTLKYLVDNDFSIGVSLDGAPACHDANRVFRSGSPTHATVIDRLALIRKAYPEYLARKVTILCTLTPDSDLLDVFRYFNTPAWHEIAVRVSLVRQPDRLPKVKWDVGSRKRSRRLDQLAAEYISSLKNGTGIHYLMFQNVLGPVFGAIAKREIGAWKNNRAPCGLCIPGQADLFASVAGNFYICHQCAFPGYEIGDCRNGFDVPRIKRLLEDSLKWEKDMCRDCWAYRLCRLCLSNAFEKGELSRKRWVRECRSEKESLRQALERFVRLWESEPESSWDNTHTLHYAARSHFPVLPAREH